MRRFVLPAIVALLTLGASGLSSLVLAEPCTGYEEAGQSDTACPPSCVTCGCCAQAVEPVTVVVAGSLDVPAAEIVAVPPGVPTTDPRPILHVPKFRSA